MENIKYIYWQDDRVWLGFLEEYPDYWTQGKTIEELVDNLKDIYKEFSNETIPNVRKVAEFKYA
jgi:predicted RNase H-like HicB family nuclease